MSEWAKLDNAREAGRAYRARLIDADAIAVLDQAGAKIRDELDAYGASVVNERELYLIAAGVDFMARYAGTEPTAPIGHRWAALFAILTPYIEEVAP